jgi:methylated-DNA-protein-cysteine methyltransferase-like protein
MNFRCFFILITAIVEIQSLFFYENNKGLFCYNKGMNFREKVIAAVGKVPHGKVVSYGQVAAYCGSPRASRQVGWMLHTLDGNNQVPWWRVINTKGVISIKGNLMSTPLAQKNFLESEGVEVDENFSIDIERYRYYFPISKSGL